MISIHDVSAVERLWRSHKLDAQLLRRLRNRFYKQQHSSDAALAELPGAVRGALGEAIAFHTLRLQSRHDSDRDGATKLLFETSAGNLIESVILRIASGRTALCVSSQAGCAARCEFCATGTLGLIQNLSRDEILDQIIQANQLLATEGRTVRNVVFMGMGEPLHNEGPLHAALDVLTSAACFHIGPQRVLVSTVGVPAAMVRCARRFPKVRMALSLHSVRPEIRRRIIPISGRYNLAELRDAVRQVAAIQSQPVMIEYVMLAGLNDTEFDIDRLSEYLRGLPVHINLIPYNPIPAAPQLSGSDPARRAEFAGALKAAGFRVTTRYSLGADITAACGQLARQNRRTAPPKREPMQVVAPTV